MPKVSVIVPVYNTEKYLSKCFENLINQTLKEIEIICINDGSTDNSLTVLNRYANQDKRIKIIDFKENQGVSIARNTGIKAATGEYIGFVDSDDFVDLDFYEKLYTKAQETGADIVKGELKEILTDGRIRTYPQNDNLLKYSNKLCFYLSFTVAIYKKELQEKERIFFDPRLVHTEDLVWLNRMVIRANKVEIVPDVYYQYKRRKDSTDTQALSKVNALSAYIGWKHIFLNTLNLAKSSDLNFSYCFQNYWMGVLSFIFRTSDPEMRIKFCKLLSFFYHTHFDFYDPYLSKHVPLVYSFLKENKINELVEFMKDKHSYSELAIITLRFNIRQRQPEKLQKISIIIPVYNVQDYLKKCLDSVCGQTHQNLEIICVDDCSTDNSLAILQEYAKKDKRIQIIQRDENGGQAAARQTGIDAATGDYIGFIDSDDWLDADYYEKMVEKAQQNRTDIVINAHILVHEGEKVYPKNFLGHKSLQEKVYDTPSQLMDKIFCVVWNKLFKSEFLKARKYTIPARSAHEDVFFHYTTFAFAKNISFFNGPAYHYLLREQSISNQKHDWGVEHIKVYSQIYDFYKENNLLDKKIKLYSTMPFFAIKDESMFKKYKNYFEKVVSYINQNADLFSEADIFIANCIARCKNYAEYVLQYPTSLMMIFLRRKR